MLLKVKLTYFVSLLGLLGAVATVSSETAIGQELIAIGLAPNRSPEQTTDPPCLGEEVFLYIDNEEDDNRNDFWVRDRYGHWTSMGGPVYRAGLCKFVNGGTSGNQLANTGIQICKVMHTGSLPRHFTDYVVVKLDSFCPEGSKHFVKHWDNEDDDNRNVQSGTAFDGTDNLVTSSGHAWSRINFCFVPAAGQ